MVLLRCQEDQPPIIVTFSSFLLMVLVPDHSAKILCGVCIKAVCSPIKHNYPMLKKTDGGTSGRMDLYQVMEEHE